MVNKKDQGAALHVSLLVTHAEPSAQTLTAPHPLPGHALSVSDHTMPFVDRGFPVDVTFSSCQTDPDGTVGRRERETGKKETAVGQLISEERDGQLVFPSVHHLFPGGLPLPKLNFQPHTTGFQEG